MTIERSQYAVETRDGWELVVSRYRATAVGLPLSGEPLLLVHGFSQNRHAWTSGALVKTLAGQGVDVHVAELRGHGKSSLARQRRRHRSTGRALPADLEHGWDADTLLLEDIPSLVSAAARTSGRARIFYAGHSLGGVLGYAHASRCADLDGLITLGAAVEMGRDSWPVRLAAHAEPVLFPWKAPVPMDAFLKGYGWLLAAEGRHQVYGWLCELASDLVLLSNPGRVGRRTVDRLLRVGGEKEARRVLSQLAGWVRGGAVTFPRAGVDLRDALGRIEVPLLVLYGEADKLANRRGTEPAVRMVKSEYRRWHGLSGHGHLELTMGLQTDVIASHIGDLMRYVRERRPGFLPG